jgi:adenylyl-sulfate kinase
MGCVLWFTGLSGSGKSTIAEALKGKLESLDRQVKIIDGDDVRNTINKKLGFSREDIRENNKIIATLANESTSFYDFILVPIISPYFEDRKNAKKIIRDDFCEVFISTSLQECINRDVKGLYKKAKEGIITNMVGFSDMSPYEIPKDPDISIDSKMITVDMAVEKIYSYLLKNQLV